MKTPIIILTLLFGTLQLIAQRDTSLTTNVERSIYVLDLASTTKQIQNFLATNQIETRKLKEADKHTTIDFVLSPQQYSNFLNESRSWGQYTRQEIDSKNYFDEIAQLESKLTFQQNTNTQYQNLLDKLTPQDPNYMTLWRDVRKNETEINATQQQIAQLRNSNRQFWIHLEIIEQQNPTDSDDDFSLVNMPGLEYAYLHIETPKTGLSADTYQGLFLKYMFTRGKSYGLIGALKNLKQTNDTTTNELFVFALGQDFYSRYLGRGQRKSLNLYSSFNLGYLIGSTETSRIETWYMSAFIGLEILKTKYLLLDNKIGYTIPFSYNRNLRGLDYRVSFNFVF